MISVGFVRRFVAVFALFSLALLAVPSMSFAVGGDEDGVPPAANSGPATSEESSGGDASEGAGAEAAPPAAPEGSSSAQPAEDTADGSAAPAEPGNAGAESNDDAAGSGTAPANGAPEVTNADSDKKKVPVPAAKPVAVCGIEDGWDTSAIDESIYDVSNARAGELIIELRDKNAVFDQDTVPEVYKNLDYKFKNQGRWFEVPAPNVDNNKKCEKLFIGEDAFPNASSVCVVEKKDRYTFDDIKNLPKPNEFIEYTGKADSFVDPGGRRIEVTASEGWTLTDGLFLATTAEVKDEYLSTHGFKDIEDATVGPFGYESYAYYGGAGVDVNELPVCGNEPVTAGDKGDKPADKPGDKPKAAAKAALAQTGANAATLAIVAVLLTLVGAGVVGIRLCRSHS